jgi:ribosomal protein L40E
MINLDGTRSDNEYYYIYSLSTGIVKSQIPIWRCKKCNGTNTYDITTCSNCGTPKPKIKTNKDPKNWTESTYE